MKNLFFGSLLLCCACSLTAQEPTYNKSITAFVGLWGIGLPMQGTGFNAPGIQHEYRQNPFIVGLEYTKRAKKRWHYFASLQGSLHYMNSLTTLRAPQPLSPTTERLQTSFQELEALQVMLGGGVQFNLIEQKKYRIHLNGGLMVAYTRDRRDRSRGISLLTPDGSGWIQGGEVRHNVTRQFTLVDRLGLGGVINLPFAPHFSIGGDLFYYLSPYFMGGSWTRNAEGSSMIATSGTYKGGLNNWVLALNISYRY
jgi:hypothetical protein